MAANSARGWYRAWAALGVALLMVEAVTLARWIGSPSFAPAPVGLDPIPAGELLRLRSMEAFGLVGFLVVAWFFLLSPLLRRRELTADGVIFLAMITAYWLDPVYNYVGFIWFYNAYAFNIGSWISLVPGMSAPGQESFPEPLLGAGCLWFMAFAVAARYGAQLYGWLRACFGPAAQLRPLVALFAIAAVFDVAFETLYIRMGVFGFASVWSPVTLWAGTRAQFPLYEPVFLGLVLGGLALLRHHVDDRGRMMCEAGLEGHRGVRSFLAVTGFCQALVIVGWMMPYQWFAIHVDTVAPLPSYLRAGVCGEGTPRACADGRAGVPTRMMQPAYVIPPGHDQSDLSLQQSRSNANQ